MKTSRIAGVCAAVLAAAGCTKNTEQEAKAVVTSTPTKAPIEVSLTADQVQHGKIRWSQPTAGFATEGAIVPGQLAPNEDRTARLGAPASGRIIAVSVRPGDRIVRGQVLLTMQSAEAGAAQSDVAKAQAEVASRQAQAVYAKTARDRAQRLLDLKAIPRQDFERAVADDELARATVEQARAELRRALSTAEQLGAGVGPGSVSGRLELRSPIAGVALSRTALPGTVVEAGTPLATVTDPSNLWLLIHAPEKLAVLFRRGGVLRFTVPAFATDTFVARIDAVGAGLDPETRTLEVRAVTESASGRLKPEMLASVHVNGASTIPAVVILDDAIQLLDGMTVVFVVTPDGKGGGKFTAREVAVGSRATGRAAITRGLSAGDLVVTEGAIAIKAQLKKGSMPGMKM